MASSTLLYIAWPLTLGLSFMAGSMILSSEPATESSKDGNQPSKISRKISSSNGSANENSAATNRRSSITHSLAGKRGYPEYYDIKEIANTNDPLDRMTKFLNMIDQLELSDFEQAVADLRGIGGNRTGQWRTEYGLLLHTWAKINPEGALADAKKNSESTFASSTILSTWAGYAPDAAIQWVKLNFEGNKASSYLVDIVVGMASNNLERATALMNELPVYRQRKDAMYRIKPHLSKLSTKKAIAWLATIKGEKLHASATSSISYSLAKQDPQATADWLETLPAKTLNYNAATVAREWAEQDIHKAALWISSLEGKTRTKAATAITYQFVSSDPNKAATWMRTMSGDPGYEKIVERFMNTAIFEHPKVALANLDQIGDEKKREGVQHNSLLMWCNKNKGAAIKWMQSNNIDAALQKKILSYSTKSSDGHQ